MLKICPWYYFSSARLQRQIISRLLFFCSPDLAVSATVVKQEDVFTRDNIKFVRISLNVMTSGNFVDFRTLRDIDTESLATKISEDGQFGNRIKVNYFHGVQT